MATDDMVRFDGQEHFVPVLEVDQLKGILQSPQSPTTVGNLPSNVHSEKRTKKEPIPPVAKSTPDRSVSASDDQAKIDFESASPIGRIGKRKSRDEDPGVT